MLNKLFFILFVIFHFFAQSQSENKEKEIKWRVGFQADLSSANLTKSSLRTLSRMGNVSYILNDRFDIVLEARQHHTYSKYGNKYIENVSVLFGTCFNILKKDSIIGLQVRGLYGFPVYKYADFNREIDFSANLIFLRSFYFTGGFRYIKYFENTSINAPTNNYNLYCGIGFKFKFKYTLSKGIRTKDDNKT